jgi:hypothetical protein
MILQVGNSSTVSMGVMLNPALALYKVGILGAAGYCFSCGFLTVIKLNLQDISNSVCPPGGVHVLGSGDN